MYVSTAKATASVDPATGNMSATSTLSLTIANHNKVKTLLSPLKPDEVQAVGLELGLSYIRLKRMRNDLDDVVNSWLKLDDDVRSYSGEPCWESLVKALQSAGHNGIAEKVKKGKYCSRTL